MREWSYEGDIIVERASANVKWANGKCDLIRARAITSTSLYAATIVGCSICISLLPSSRSDSGELIPLACPFSERIKASVMRI